MGCASMVFFCLFVCWPGRAWELCGFHNSSDCRLNHIPALKRREWGLKPLRDYWHETSLRVLCKEIHAARRETRGRKGGCSASREHLMPSVLTLAHHIPEPQVHFTTVVIFAKKRWACSCGDAIAWVLRFFHPLSRNAKGRNNISQVPQA